MTSGEDCKGDSSGGGEGKGGWEEGMPGETSQPGPRGQSLVISVPLDGRCGWASWATASGSVSPAAPGSRAP